MERANGNVKDMLVAWMGDNDTNDWSVSITFVQFQKNSSYHSGIQRSPYAAMFGCEATVGLTSSSCQPISPYAAMFGCEATGGLTSSSCQPMQSEDDLISATSNLPVVLEHTAAPHTADIHESVPSTSRPRTYRCTSYC